MPSVNPSIPEDRQTQHYVSSSQDWNGTVAHSNKLDNRSVQNPLSQRPGGPQKAGGTTPKQQPKMSKVQAQTLVTRIKRTTLVTSIVAFGLFGTLIAPQIQATLTKSSSTTQKAISTTTATPTQSSGSFFDQSQTGGYSIGTSSSASTTSTSGTSQSTTPGTSTHVS